MHRPGAIWSRASASMRRIFSRFWARLCPRWRPQRQSGRPGGSEGRAGCSKRCGCLLATPRDFLDARFSHPKVKAMMAAWGLHLDFAPDVAGGALFPYLECMANQTFGMVIGKGGADTIVNAMTRALKARGAVLILGAPVARIDVSSGRASGVTLADGRHLEARRAVIANVHPKLVFGRLRRFGSRAQKFRTRRLCVPSGAGHHDDPPRARRSAQLERRRARCGASPTCMLRPTSK